MQCVGYCTSCRKVRYVRLTAAGMANVAAGGLAYGVCFECERKGGGG